VNPPDPIADRLAALRRLMAERGYDALFVPRADEYLGEYILPRNERLRWLTGFSGSAGTALVLAERAAIFVDGRYRVQVRDQVPADFFSYHHLLEEPPAQWLAHQLPRGARVCCDPRLHSYRWFIDTRDTLLQAGLEWVTDSDNLIDACWLDRPPPTVSEALLLDIAFSGEASAAKRARIGASVAAQGCDAALIFAPDAVSWLLNVRGTDLPQLPVLPAFALLEASGGLTLFSDSRRLPAGFAAHVGEGVQVQPECEAPAVFAGLCERRVLTDASTASAHVHLLLQQAEVNLVQGDDPVSLPKACKNPVELAGARAAHLRDAVAVCRFLAWLDAEVSAGRLHDEALLSERLLALRRAGEHFHAVSFDTISAAGANAALCHYNHRNGQPATLSMNSVYLCDSGGQYTDGTTDITRTVPIGDPGEEVRRLYSLVLKGHIALASARFPPGTTGMQLDSLARQFLWREGFDFDHGTGHGVGAFLSVHEGPQRISKTGAVALRPGMIVSNEPGYYRDGEFGMRCENLLAVRASSATELETPMLEFEVLTLVPFDSRLLDRALLDAREIAWLDAYHRRVAAALEPLLDAEARDWLLHATRPLAGACPPAA
tara:strand:- start:4687 stop:6498 length:1812 start_codon:yes stop_codon:yes gene_type:complete